MARPIKDTPVIRGKDAKRFAAKIANPVPISKEEREKMERVYQEFLKMSKSPF